MIHDIQINDGILANIYIREKNEKGEILDIDDILNMNRDSEDIIINNNINLSATIRQLPNYSEMYETDLESIKTNSLTKDAYTISFGTKNSITSTPDRILISTAFLNLEV